MQWGPQFLGGDRVRFALWAPDKDSVALEIDGRDALPMQRSADGWFTAEAPARTGDRYRFRISDDLAVADPASRAQSGGVHGWSVLSDPFAYEWRMQEWSGRPWTEAVIQEVHPGVLGGFSGVAEHLPQLAQLGVTAIELMPVAAFAGTRGWGYDGVLPYAVHESYGSPDDLKALVDRAHDLGLMVFLDVVYNHFGPEGNYLGAYASSFFDQHSDTPWGSAVAVSREPVKRFFIDNARMWLQEYRLDGLRFDAVHAIADDAFLDAMAQEIREALPGRHVHLVLENEHNDPERLRPGLYDAQWNDDFHNVLHVLLTGESEGYYEAFVENPTEKLARCLSEGFIHQGEEGRGKPSGHLPATRFVSFLQNHDQVGNRALGERLIRLADRDKLRAATALLLLMPQIPLLFMGEESGSRSPFLFFTDFHDELADAVREGRRKEFAKFAAFSDPETRKGIPDPNDQETFDTSVPRPGPDAEEWRAFYSQLIALRHQHIMPRLEETRGMGAEVLGTGAVVARWVMHDGARLILAINLGETGVSFPEEGECLFALGEAGEPGSFTARLSL
ncbi:malto-oligosyltrehalose trehalohydrolase [Altericroceibacterium xinjiangense]|uniref:malto-oligosyltrehalose trehalohydrolase n=1 Tax=Altericroceibacterium xinjiangense TaxID=762261 RepID=UPI000F7F663C|nr:malto-oligosyltrehalose trehalohydrolase [Altericroceibacterium xinjiangense]